MGGNGTTKETVKDEFILCLLGTSGQATATWLQRGVTSQLLSLVTPVWRTLTSCGGGTVDRRGRSNGPSSKMMLLRSRGSGSFLLSYFLQWGRKELLSLQGCRLPGNSPSSTDNGVLLPVAHQSSKESLRRLLKNSHLTWESTSPIPGFRRQKEEDLCKFKARLGYLVNSRPVKMAQGNSVSNQQIKDKKLCAGKINGFVVQSAHCSSRGLSQVPSLTD